MNIITIAVEGIKLEAELIDTPTAQAIWEALPIEGAVDTWGEEIYFNIPVNVAQEPEARADVSVGELGYWPVGQAFCIFFGRTPASKDESPRAASPVNVFGRIRGDTTLLKPVKSGAVIRFEQTNAE